MGSSAKKKREKAKDFQKAKLKVGKAKAKASNFTDTGFKSKSIVMGHQSLSEVAPDLVKQFKHQVSLATTSKSEKQRKEALSYLTTQLSATPPNNPIGTYALLMKILPLVSDLSAGVRTQLIKALRCLPAAEVRNHAEKTIMFVRAGLTHVSAKVSNDALEVLSWLLEIAADEVVCCPGGWVKTLNSFCAIMGWSTVGNSGWTQGRSSMRTKDNMSYAKQISALAKFIHIGLSEETTRALATGGYWDTMYSIPRQPEPFAYLNMFGKRTDEDGEMYADREARQRVFRRKFFELISAGNNMAQKEGGAPGRAAADLNKAIEDGMNGFDMSGGSEGLELDGLW
ncbi:hypothetical protein TD95_004668 [Thielaviopsis punctulata]|uniref:Pre-rRNA-processing protein n=1 Tax=Thielaviopsis punctulata TaxID=72032 RepID=A0A0F4ZFN9_9PEZI|nr:hypothetical protein TD95_004668 [Thielaviopsis punctulata]